ncbi:unnamed protein product [Caenorhabditis bovis]|uniref:Uncharacterized protein n=1 Tax=Caenorhabditis bovis TaxID=2654633 RepID=A0A8S1FFE3_9PELO|nr:unnamed protein product [Caenorhabditis bovis]
MNPANPQVSENNGAADEAAPVRRRTPRTNVIQRIVNSIITRGDGDLPADIWPLKSNNSTAPSRRSDSYPLVLIGHPRNLVYRLIYQTDAVINKIAGDSEEDQIFLDDLKNLQNALFYWEPLPKKTPEEIRASAMMSVFDQIPELARQYDQLMDVVRSFKQHLADTRRQQGEGEASQGDQEQSEIIILFSEKT